MVTIGTTETNRPLNRFANITVCKCINYTWVSVTKQYTISNCTDDDNRIQLSPVKGEQSDYINACYIDVSRHVLNWLNWFLAILFVPIHSQGLTTPQKFIATQGGLQLKH